MLTHDQRTIIWNRLYDAISDQYGDDENIMAEVEMLRNDHLLLSANEQQRSS